MIELIITIQTENMMGKRKGISITVPIQIPEGEASERILPSDEECFQNNHPECDDKDKCKRQDTCAGNSSNDAFFDRQRRNAYRSDTHFQERRRDSFKRGRQNRGYRNHDNERQHPSSYRENNYHYGEVNLLRKTIPVFHTSALLPFLKGTETQSLVLPLKKRGRPCKQPLIPRGTAGENVIMSASTPPRHHGLRWCRWRI
ncbi:hypothetical protein TNCV_2575171 [Trichonephila clavipes]|nr:hypothetical protein TNCV_2575171 [Trichonephila clavipes]